MNYICRKVHVFLKNRFLSSCKPFSAQSQQRAASSLISRVELKPQNEIKFMLWNRNCSFSRNYSQGIPNIDPKQQARRRGLMILTYVSGFIGAILLTAVGAREYQKLKYRARGIKPIKNRLYGRRPVLFQYRGYNVPNFIVNKLDDIHSFEVREDDIWVVSFPKAGTTWLQEIVYLIQSDGDFDTAKSVTIDSRFPFFEFEYPGLKTIANNPSPRLIKSHLPFSLLPNGMKEKQPKVIYIARNPKDTVVSYYHFVQFMGNLQKFTGSFEDFCQLFVNDQGSYGPWWKHVKEAWDKRNDDNVLFLTYEDLKTDLIGAVKKIAAFLGKTLSPGEVEAIVSHCSFDEMKKNNHVNYEWLKNTVADKDSSFMRKGKVGDWKNQLSKEVVDKLDEMVMTKLEPSGLVFTDSLEDV